MRCVWIVCLVTAFVLTGCSAQEVEAEKPRPVRTMMVAMSAPGEPVTQTGEVRPHSETDLGFRIDGRLASRAVDVGARVTKGQVLAILDARDVANDLRAAEADLRSAQSSESLARITVDRQQALVRIQAVAQARLDEAEANWKSALARREAAAATLETMRNKVTYTRLSAPETGVVTAIGANPGQVVATGQMVVKLAATDERDAVFFVSEKIVNAGSPDAKVMVSLVSDPSVRVIGSIRDVSPTAEAATRSYRVRVTVPDAPAAMAFGATVSGQVVLEEEPLAVLPASALTSQAGGPAVYVVDPVTLTLQRKPIVVSRYTTSQIFAASGLAPGDRVVVAGVSKLRPGQRVAMEAGAS